jgi:hypothetical protein
MEREPPAKGPTLGGLFNYKKLPIDTCDLPDRLGRRLLLARPPVGLGIGLLVTNNSWILTKYPYESSHIMGSPFTLA